VRRLRSALAAASLVLGASTATLVTTSTRVQAKLPLDVYNLRGNAVPVEVTVQNAYSFLLYPDIQVPRANASIAAGHTTAIASPADPGDGTDSLPGLVIPMVEAGFSPAPGYKQISPVFSVVNPVITYPFEHVQADYPDPHRPGPVSGTFGVDPSVSDPTQTFGVHAAVGKVTAGDGMGIADAGAGAGISAPALGLSIGRVSSHVELHNLGSTVTSDAVSELDNVDLSPPGLVTPPGGSGAPLHIGSIVATAHSERTSDAPQATGTHKLEFAGVLVAGQAATIDDSGVHLLHQNIALGPLVQAINTLFAAASGPNGSLKSVPIVGGQAIIPAGSMAGPIVKEAVSHNGNEHSASISGITLSMRGTIVAPPGLSPILKGSGSITQPPVATAVTYTITLATASSSAYGYTFPPLPPTLPVLPPVETGFTGGELTIPPAELTPPSTEAPPTTTPSTAGGGQQGGRPRLVLTSTSTDLVAKPIVLTVAALAETLLLSALAASYRLRPRPLAGPSPTDMDLP